MKMLGGILAVALLTTVHRSGIPTQHTPVFSSKIESVRIDVMVTDGREPVLGLQPRDFTVTDAGVSQTIDIVAFEEVPLNVVLALDVSGSVAGERLRQLRMAGRALLDHLKPNDRVALLTFGAAVSVHTGLTNDVARVRDALTLPHGADDTALIDASYSAMALSHADSGRPLVVVFSDGMDTASFLRPADVLASAKRNDAVIYAVSSGEPAQTTFLSELCNLSGGRVLHLASTEELGQTFVRVLEEFRHRYLISYTPRGVPGSGWHPLEVKVIGRRLTVTARRGYLAQ